MPEEPINVFARGNTDAPQLLNVQDNNKLAVEEGKKVLKIK